MISRIAMCLSLALLLPAAAGEDALLTPERLEALHGGSAPARIAAVEQVLAAGEKGRAALASAFGGTKPDLAVEIPPGGRTMETGHGIGIEATLRNTSDHGGWTALPGFQLRFLSVRPFGREASFPGVIRAGITSARGST